MSALVHMNVIRNQKQNTETSDLRFKGSQCTTVQTDSIGQMGEVLWCIPDGFDSCVAVGCVESDDNDIAKKCESFIQPLHHRKI